MGKIKNNLVEFDEIDSTNKFAKDNYSVFSDETIFVTNYQSNGRGRLGRSFVSNKNENVLLSVLLKSEFAINNFELLSILVGAAVSITLDSYNIKSMIKWPNDVLVNDKKICGILLESVANEKIEAIIVGIGLNVNQVDFKDLPYATSMKNVSLNLLDIKEVKDKLINTFMDLYHGFIDGDKTFIQYIKDHDYFKGQFVEAEIDGKKERIKVLDILDNGHLLIEHDGKEKEIRSGELSFHNIMQ